MYKCLRNVYNYDRDRIIVLMSDGTSPDLDRHNLTDGTYSSSPQDLDGDGTDDMNYSATWSNISTVFNYLRDHVTGDEQVFVFVTDHRVRKDGKSYVVLWDDYIMSSYEFAIEIRKINPMARKHVSVNFNNPLGEETTITRYYE